MARLLGVWVRTKDGEIAESVNITDPIGITMEYELTVPGKAILPLCNLFNEEGIWVFDAFDVDPVWRGRPRPAGRYRTTAWIPGNLLTEGRYFVSVCVHALKPRICQFWEREAVAFHVVDTLDPNSARGDWKGPIAGVVRPLLHWENELLSVTTDSVRT